jgi:hypothetical protein
MKMRSNRPWNNVSSTQSRVRILLRTSISVLALGVLPGFFVLVIFFHGLLRIAKLPLHSAHALVELAFHFLRLVPSNLAHRLLNFAAQFFSTTVHLWCIKGVKFRVSSRKSGLACTFRISRRRSA